MIDISPLFLLQVLGFGTGLLAGESLARFDYMIKQKSEWHKNWPPSENGLLLSRCSSRKGLSHTLVLRKWNNEVFSAIAGPIGTVTGIFLIQKT